MFVDRWRLPATGTTRPRRSKPSDERVVASDNKSFYTVIMLRTQISLNAEELRAARLEAKRLGISMAELLRRSLRMLLPADNSRPWMRYAGMIESGDAESSRRIDDVIYGQKD